MALCLLLSVSSILSGQGLQPFVATVNPTGAFETPTVVGSKLFYVSSSAAAGSELWVTDGTEAGCHLVKDIYLSTGNSSPHDLMVVGNTLFFFAADGIHGDKLWMSDGTEAGTKLVTDQSPNGYASDPLALIIMGNRLIMTTTAQNSQRLLFAIDETGTATKLSPVIQGGFSVLANLNNRLLFSQNGDSLFIFNETLTAKTLLKTNFRIRTTSANTPVGIAMGNRFYFTATVGNNNYEPWVTDGTAAGTFMLKDIDDSGGSEPSRYTTYNGKVYFSTTSGPFGAELYSTDGTIANTDTVKNINLQNGGVNGSFPTSLTVVGDSLYFVATDGFYGMELYVTGGTSASTRRLTDLVVGTLPGNIKNLTPFQGKLIFQGITSDTLFARENGMMTKFKLAGASFNGSFFSSGNMLLFPIVYGLARIFPDLSISTYTNTNVTGYTSNLFPFANRIFGTYPANKLCSIQESQLVSSRPSIAESSVAVYPNPSHDKIWIQTPADILVQEVMITDMQGKVVLRSPILNQNDFVDVSSLPSGIFQVRVTDGTNQHLFRFLKN